MQKAKTYFIIAGEASGDLHGSNLIKALKEFNSQARFVGLGGDLMEAQGMTLYKHYRDLDFMGFIEVIKNIRTISANLRLVKSLISDIKPDVLILIDYPGFNLRMADFAKKMGIKVVYYISPQIWAWKQGRVHQIKRNVDLMLTILPFETDFYKSFDYQAHFVGHPLLDAIDLTQQPNRDDFTTRWGLNNKPIIALLPGSRRQEIQVKLPIMLSVQQFFPEYQFVIAKARSQALSTYEPFLKGSDVALVDNDTYNLLQLSSAACVTSGTATLETALFDVPQVVCYKGSYISYHIAKRLIKVAYISLVNLIMNRPVLCELIQDECNTQRLKEELKALLAKDRADQVRTEYAELRQKLGGMGASRRAAQLIFNL